MWGLVLFAIAGLIARIYYVVPMFAARGAARKRRKGKAAQRSGKMSLCAVFGSGGHTAEMVRLLRGVDYSRYNTRVYVVGNTDTMSTRQIHDIEGERRNENDENYIICTIPRSRGVGQSWTTTPITVIWSLICACRHMWVQMPDVVLCNGPGNCVVICYIAMVMRIFRIKHIPIIYIESFARVRSLSLSGKLVYPIADRFIVQWPYLEEMLSRAEFIPNLV